MSDERLVTITVDGEPVPQGSMQAMVPVNRKTGEPFRRQGGGIVANVIASNEKRLKPWRELVRAAAEDAWGPGRAPIEGVSLAVEVLFYMPRPAGDWGTGRNAHLLKDKAPAYPLVYPDVDKLLRGLLDGMTGVVYKDDALVSRVVVEKRYAVPDEVGDALRAEVAVLRRRVQLACQLELSERVRVPPRPPAAEQDEAQAALAW